MHLVFSASGSLGDLAPLICLAVELRTRGHECVFAVNGHHRTTLEQMGFSVEITGSAEEYNAVMGDPTLNNPRCFYKPLLGMAARELPGVYRAILRVARPESVLVYRVTSMAARVAAEKLGLRDCAVSIMPYELGSTENPPAYGHPLLNQIIRALPVSVRRRGAASMERRVMGPMLFPALQELRREAGLPPMAGLLRAEVRKCSEIMLVFPEWFGPRESQWPPHMLHAGFLFLPRVADPDPAVAEFLEKGSPPLLVTMGSAIRSQDGLAERLIRIAGGLGLRILCTDFSQKGQAVVEGDVCRSPAIWLDPVLPSCGAVAHRGGVGMMAMALRYGVPQLIVGQVMDHPDNGERVTRLGAGRWCYTETTTDRAMRKALAAVAGDPALRRGAEACAARIAADPSLALACDRIEALGGGR